MSKDKVHVIFFHGIGDNHKSASEFCQILEKEFKDGGMSSVYIHAHKYPTAFQNYIAYSVVSFLFLGTSILAPIIMIACSPSIMVVELASLAALTCIFLSILLIAVPFIYRNKNLFKSSIGEIDQLIEEGVNPGKIVLFGHSFGGIAASEVLKHFADKNVELGGILFNSSFSSFEKAIRNFPIPQTKILSILPSPLLSKLLKALDLNFDIAKDIQELQSKEKLNIPIVITNNKKDELIPPSAQLSYAITSSTGSITIRNVKNAEGSSAHNSFNEVSIELYNLAQSKVSNT